MVEGTLAYMDVARKIFEFLETSPQLVAILVPCSVEVACHTRAFIPGFSKIAMLKKRRSRDDYYRLTVQLRQTALEELTAELIVCEADRDAAVCDYESTAAELEEATAELNLYVTLYETLQYQVNRAEAFSASVVEANQRLTRALFGY